MLFIHVQNAPAIFSYTIWGEHCYTTSGEHWFTGTHESESLHVIYEELPFPGFNSPVNEHQEDDEPKLPTAPATYDLRPAQGEIRLAINLAVQAPGKNDEEQRTKKVVD